MHRNLKTVLVTGGAGYVGSALVPRLLREGYCVKVLDLYLFGEEVFAGLSNHPNLIQIQGDIRDRCLLETLLPGCDAVIHLASISNDPSFELNPALSRSINYEAFGPLVQISKESRVRRFIYASTSSVYGVSDADEVTEDHPLVPITDYNRTKALCEPVLLGEGSPDFTTVVIRPATVCGYAPRMRLDLTVNLLTNHAVNLRRMTVFGGEQKRPNIHIEDLADLYSLLLELPEEKISGKIFNAGHQNCRVREIAEMVKRLVEEEMPEGGAIAMERVPTDDTRSYHISSQKIERELGFAPKRTIEDAVRDLVAAFREGKIPNPMTERRYYNVQTLKELELASSFPLTLPSPPLGERVKGEGAGILKSLFYQMLRIRIVEEKIAELYSEQEIRCPVHLCTGQEAVAVGVSAHLNREDYAMSGHRSHGHYLAKGGDLRRMVAELYGKATGCSGGKGGSMHLADLSAGFLGATPIVGSSIAIAVGTAFASVFEQVRRVTVVFFGEAAVEEGVFCESVNFAVLKKLPVVFICENNLYSVQSPLSVRQPEGREVIALARGLGVESFQGDGNRVEEVYELAGEATRRARAGGGPTFLEFKTYRWREHCGPNDDTDLGYRSKAELLAWKSKCPIARLEKELIGQGLLTEEEIVEMTEKLRGEMDDAIRFAKESPFPEEVSLYEDVYAS